MPDRLPAHYRGCGARVYLWWTGGLRWADEKGRKHSCR